METFVGHFIQKIDNVFDKMCVTGGCLIIISLVSSNWVKMSWMWHINLLLKNQKSKNQNCNGENEKKDNYFDWNVVGFWDKLCTISIIRLYSTNVIE